MNYSENDKEKISKKLLEKFKENEYAEESLPCGAIIKVQKDEESAKVIFISNKCDREEKKIKLTKHLLTDWIRIYDAIKLLLLNYKYDPNSCN